MIILETLQSWIFLLVLLVTVALGTRLLVDFMTLLSGDQITVEHTREATPETAPLYLIPELPAEQPRQLPLAADPRK